MTFSARQLHCLDAMGIVAWTRDIDVTPSQLIDEQAPATALLADNAQPQDDRSAVDTLSAPAALSAINQLAEWLVGQPLTQLNYKGRQANSFGPEHAELMVVCLNSDTSDQLPLSPDSARLFDLMMRAIAIQRTGFRQCVVPVHPLPAENGSGSLYLDDILTAHTRAVVVLDPVYASDTGTLDSEKALLPTSLLPLWRLPHPAVLLQTPALKRHAWQVLKNVQQALDDHAN